MKRPIEPADIRKGDLIRWEQEPSLISEYAIEYRATEDGYFQSVTGQHYLLDRPSPPVELPTEPTLGWLENVYGARILKHWFRGEGVAEAFDGDRWNFTKEVIAFTPAVGVPKVALDELRGALLVYLPTAEDVISEVADFLAAVDEANA
jgi:hypothetical protein